MRGPRRPSRYGREVPANGHTGRRGRAADREFEIGFRQPNDEGRIVDRIQEARQHVDAIMIGPVALPRTPAHVFRSRNAAELASIAGDRHGGDGCGDECSASRSRADLPDAGRTRRIADAVA
ncbi:MAG: type II 3-dehydroquinate dehydratase [Alphaproteobacteria bacterium]|nr:type II 3-dehydroquinate dehydratase [Alphaproteobacteria bacterium]